MLRMIPAFLPKGREEIEERSWGVEEAEEEEEVAEEEESPRGSWRKDGNTAATDNAAETSSRVSDWREAAFHGDSPEGSLKSSRWTPAVEEPSFAEAAHSQAVAVSTLDEKPADAPAPFSGDAWAAAMAAGVEEKLAQAQEVVEAAKEPESLAETTAVVEEAAVTAPAPVIAEEAHSEEPVKVSESSNGWYSISSSPWDAEAKKASLLAATWDTPAEEPAPAVIEQPEPVVPEPVLEDATASVVEEGSHYAGSATEIHVEHQESFVGHQEDAQTESSTQGTYEEERIETHHESHASETWQTTETFQAEEKQARETHEEQPAPVVAETKSWENTWETGASLPAEKFAEMAHEEAHPAAEEHVAPHDEPVAATEAAPSIEQISETHNVAAEAGAAKPDMDALVARVLEKMNPEVLQKMTHEILRPVIEAIIHEELNSKKS